MEDFFQQLINNSVSAYNERNPAPKPNRWKYCKALLEDGWVSPECYMPEDSSDLVFVWKKEGDEREVKVRLSFVEQQLWLEFLEHKYKEENRNATKEGIERFTEASDESEDE